MIEDTGLAEWLPLGEGVVTFTEPATAVAGIERINGDYACHRRAARRLAENFFSTDKVLRSFLVEAMS